MTILKSLQDKLSSTIFGQAAAAESILVTIVAGGHALLEGVPGLAKTTMVRQIASALNLKLGRIQGTPDLMPSDILGCEVLDEDENGARSFRFVRGAIFSNCFMMDEINRAPPRTQAALLQAMEEGFITIGGHDYQLPRPFHVLATQNPIEHAGTYPLPEAQSDRFLMKIVLDYPCKTSEENMLRHMLQDDGENQLECDAIDLENAKQMAMKIPVGQSVVNGVLSLVRGLRPSSPRASEVVREYVIWGPSPRAAKGLLSACRARAVIQGRPSPSVEDVIALAVPVLAHRMGVYGKKKASEIVEEACKAI